MKRHVLRLWLLVISISCVGFLASTANHYYPNNALDPMTQFFKAELLDGNDKVSKTDLSLLWGGFIASGQLGLLLSCVISPLLADVCGRKTTITIAIVGILPGELMEGSAYYANSIALLYVGRFWSDTFNYTLQQILLVFICEVALAENRGKMATFTTITHSIGGLIATILGLQGVFGTDRSWNIPYYIFAGVGILSLPAALQLEESPQYLAMKGRDNKESLIFYQGADTEETTTLLKSERKGKTSETEPVLVNEEIENENLQKENYSDTKTERNLLRRQLLLAILMSFAMVNSGLINSYSNLLITSIGFDPKVAGYGSVALYGMAIVSGTACSVLTDRIPRRVHFIVSCICCGVSLIFLSIAQNLYEWTGRNGFAYIAVLFLFGTQLALTFGVKPIFWLVVPEIFPTQYRARAKSISYFFYAIVGVLATLFLPYLQTIVGGWIYAIMSLSVWPCVIFSAKYLPETAAKNSEEIYQSLMKTSKVSYGTMEK